MDSPRTSSRRDFLIGQAAADAVADLAERAAADAAANPLAHGEEAESAYLLQFGRRAMACQFEVFVPAGQHDRATELALEALDLVDALEAQLTVYRDSSEICDINRRASKEAVPVETRLFDLLAHAQRLHAETGGAYDITSGPLSKVWGFYRRQGELPEQTALEHALGCVGSQDLTLNAPEHTIRFERTGIELNLGSIGKGYALDRAAEVLAAGGMHDFLWHGGQSSILARGSHRAQSGGGWLISIGDPLRPRKTLARIRLRNRACGTSGSGAQFFRHEGRRFGHILDPRTGWPAEGVLSATALAPTAAQADALATAFYVMGPVATIAFCQSHPEIAAVLTCPRSGHAGVELVTAGLGPDELVRESPD